MTEQEEAKCFEAVMEACVDQGFLEPTGKMKADSRGVMQPVYRRTSKRGMPSLEMAMQLLQAKEDRAKETMR